MQGLVRVTIGLLAMLLAGCVPDAPPYVPPPIVAPPPSFTTSFTCQDGNTPTQNIICGNSTLAALDVEEASAFRQHVRTPDLFARDQILANQRAWLLGLPQACDVASVSANAPPPSVISCLVQSYQTQRDRLNNWPDQDATGGSAMAHYVRFKLLDARQPALCTAISTQASLALSADGTVDPARLAGTQEIAGTHGAVSGTLPGGGAVSVNSHQGGLYAGYQTRAVSLTLAGAASPAIDPRTLGSYVVSMANGGGRFDAYASQTGDYGAIDVFVRDGQVFALVSDTIGYYTPALAGEAAAAGLFTLDSTGTATPTCLYETYLNPAHGGVFEEQPALTPFIHLIDRLNNSPPPDLASSDRQDLTQLGDETRWTLLNMPLVVLAQAKDRGWIGWLRYRHDQVLDALYVWSQSSPENQAQFRQLLGLERSAAGDLNKIYLQQQGLTPSDARSATALAIMELLYESTAYLAPGLGSGPVDPSSYTTYQPRYSILATPQG